MEAAVESKVNNYSGKPPNFWMKGLSVLDRRFEEILIVSGFFDFYYSNQSSGD